MKWWNKIILFFTFLSLLALLLSYSAMYINPGTWWIPAFFGLGYFPLFIIYLFFCLYWLLVKRKIFFILCIFILIGYKAHASSFSLHFSNHRSEDSSQIKILSYNVKGLDAYNPKQTFLNRDNIIETIANANADIICLQEFNTYQNGSPEKSNLDALLKQTGLQYYYYYKAYENRKATRSFGIIILSRYKIVNSGVLEYESLSKLNSTIYADININGKIIRVFTGHMQSTQLSHRDLEFIDPVYSTDNTDFNAERVANKLKSSFEMRGNQVDVIKDALNKSPYPVIISGDFNDTPVSYSYQKISNNLQDAFLKKGLGIGATYVSFPLLRIDYMLFDKNAFKINNYYNIKKKYSDHYACVTEFTIR